MSALIPPGTPTVTVTFFADFAATTKREERLTLTALADLIRKTTADAKQSLPWLKLARFGDTTTDKKSLRHNANVLVIGGIEGDADNGQVNFEAAIQHMRAAGIASLIYTSPSHTEDTPRWRALCPLSMEYPPSERDRFMARLNGALSGVLANESWVLSQSYYYGSVNRNPSHQAVVIEGVCIDLADHLAATAISKPVKPEAATRPVYPAADPSKITDKRVNGKIESLLDNIRNAADGAKHHTLWDNALAIGGYLHLTDWTDEQAVERCIASLPSAKDWNLAGRTAAEAIAKGRLKPLHLEERPLPPRRNGHMGSGAPFEPQLDAQEPTSPDPEPDQPPPGWDPYDIPAPSLDEPAELPVILCVPGQLDRMYREAEAALLAAGAPIYQRTMLVRPAVVEYDAAPPSGSTVPRKTHSTALIAVTAPALTKMLSRAAIFMKWNERKKQNIVCDPPPKLVDIILASRGEWTFPVVRGVLTTPTLRPDGSLLKQPGYDPISRYYLAFPSNLVLPDIPLAPTCEHGRASLKRLDKLLDDYAFVDDNGVSHAVALAMLMTRVVRCAMPVSPLEAVSATAPGTGKSHLVDLANTIATGRPCPIINAGKNDEETEKGINTKLISGVPGFSIDNVQRELNLEALNTATERPLLSPRKFGVLEDIEIENGVVISMTGNNLAIIDEQVRRTMFCRMDAKVERPEQREFASDPIAAVLADRGRYVADVLTIVRAYVTNGWRPNIPPYGSYSEWSRFVREPLVWLGQPDPLLSQKSARADDTALNQRRDIINAWHVAFGTGAHTLAEAAKYATTVPVHPGYDRDDTQTERDDKLAAHQAHRAAQEQLLAVLRDVFPSGRDGVDTGKWGFWMRRFAGRLTDGLKFVRDGITEGTARWRLAQ